MPTATDGDVGGKQHEVALKAAGIEANRILRLPEGCAVEDLLNPDDFVAVVNDFLEKMGIATRFTRADIPAGSTVAKAFTDWAQANKAQIPSKVEIAYALLDASGRRLTPVGKRALIALHTKFMSAFSA